MKIQQILNNVIEESGIDVTIRKYSSRCMFGRDFGIVGDFQDCMEFIGYAINSLLENNTDKYELQNFVSSIMNFSMDNMGLDSVIYWSNERWDESLEDEDE